MVVGLACTGCFYVDPIYRQSMLEVSYGTDSERSGHVRRDELVTVRANYQTGNAGDYHWRARFCSQLDADQLPHGCDAQPSYTGEAAGFAFVVGAKTHDLGEPTQAVDLELDAYDDHGAVTQVRGLQTLIVIAGPTLALTRSAHSYTVLGPIDLVATYGDTGAPPADITLTWAATAPGGRRFALSDETPILGSDPTSSQAAKRLVPDTAGSWKVTVTASYRTTTTEQDAMFDVAEDQPPCLVAWQPAVPPDGARLPITGPVLFQVPLVDDDLDAYPPVSPDPLFHTASFAWSILRPGASQREPLTGATGNTLAFDPGAFSPGDDLEVRVEVFDRHATKPACPDDQAVCSIPASACIQRQTWRVEVR